jgi:26S proteasome regulatory subunit N1
LIVDKLEDIKGYVTKANFSKVNMYLSASANYSADNDEMSKTLNILYDIALGLEGYTYAMRVAIRLDDIDKIKQLFEECPDELIKKQLAFCSARQKIYIPDLPEEENKIISNSRLSEFYIELAKDLEVYEPKKPEDIFKAHLEEKGKNADISAATSALFQTYVNAFVNAGLKKDTLIIEDPNI